MKEVKISSMTRQALEGLCERNDCTMDQLIDALMSNVVSEQLSVQIHYNKTGELPQ